jgi:uncharacterized membrane protein YqjE
MSILNDVKTFIAEQKSEYESADSEDKMFMLVITGLGLLATLIVAFGILAFVFWIAKAVFPFAVGAALFYVFGVYRWGWKVPSLKRKK